MIGKGFAVKLQYTSLPYVQGLRKPLTRGKFLIILWVYLSISSAICLMDIRRFGYAIRLVYGKVTAQEMAYTAHTFHWRKYIHTLLRRGWGVGK